MKSRYKLIIKGIALLGIVGLLTSCGGSDPAPVGGGGGGGGALTIPANAVTITDLNAVDIAESAIGSLDSIGGTLDLKSAESPKTMPSIQGALNLVVDKINGRNRSSFPVATGVIIIVFCDSLDPDVNTGNGSITVDETETGNSFSGTVDFMDCQLFPGFIVDGFISFDGTFDPGTGNFNTTVSSSGLTFTFETATVSEIITMQFNFEDTGNENTGEFSEFWDFSVSGITGGGFLVTTTQAFEGNFLNINIPETLSGQIIIEGANNTRLRVTLIDGLFLVIEWDNGDGTFIDHSTIDVPA